MSSLPWPGRAQDESLSLHGRSSGPGPWHLLTPDLSATLCGVQRFTAMRPRAGSFNPERDVCPRCQVAQRHASQPSQSEPEGLSAQSEIDAACAEFDAAYAVMMSARGRLESAIRVLHRARLGDLDERLALLIEVGYRQADLGRLLGLTRAAVQRRTGRVEPGELDEIRRRIVAEAADQPTD